ncbi:tetratricopeptide repeat protein [Dyella psychrodurans]|uniref:Tetratricopeptide repeat protein n=1 Tax=Dyella psychrodurans TaxID=1927960 RepID=A0A370XAK3_9GAMM|nr:hypothetical protein [Dyella psychrodurans]RDS85307.1 hypothetical protein DWU99_07180 [Dyella psychrodurans]
MFFNAAFRSKWAFILCAITITLIVAISYWPVAHAQFVYDDILDFQKMAWLRHGSDWHQYLFRGFNGWFNYFRPLGVALFTLEVRLFNAQPEPMHLVSLLIHLFNTLLVGMLAKLTCDRVFPSNRHPWMIVVPMLLYGLHPLLVEPVVWIGCQFELTATLFMLLGWVANLGIANATPRAVSIAICFFLAACSKESALAFPFIIAIFDWFIQPEPHASKLTQLRTLLVRNWPTYLAILLAGGAYLALRHWALGALIPTGNAHPLPIWARLQGASFLYLRYWQMFFWPTVGMGPMHPVPMQPFLGFGAATVLRDIGAASILLAATLFALRRLYIAGLVLCTTFALLPVLHIISINFDTSFYHERYAMTGLAVACAWLPAALLQIPSRSHRILALTGMLVVAVWSVISIATIRVTVPLWSTQLKLWQWAVETSPDFVIAKNQLIETYLNEGDDASAWKLIAEVVNSKERCMSCMLNAAILSVRENKPERASFFLQKIKDMPELYLNVESHQTYLTTVGQIELLERHPSDAEGAERAAIALDSLNAEPQIFLAVALVQQGKIAEAQQVEATAITLLGPEDQAKQRRVFDQLVKSWQADATKNP